MGNVALRDAAYRQRDLIALLGDFVDAPAEAGLAKAVVIGWRPIPNRPLS